MSRGLIARCVARLYAVTRSPRHAAVGVAAAVALVAVVSVGPAVGQKRFFGGDPAASNLPTRAFSAADPDFRRGLRAAEARNRRRATPEAKRARKASRRKFRRATRTQAVRIARGEFPEATKGELFDGAAESGLKTERSLGDRSAVVEDEQAGRKYVVQSVLPLRDEDVSGDITASR